MPFGVGGATYLASFAGRVERELLKPFIAVLAGIPWVVLGFFGLVVTGPAVKRLFDLPLGSHRAGRGGFVGAGCSHLRGCGCHSLCPGGHGLPRPQRLVLGVSDGDAREVRG